MKLNLFHPLAQGLQLAYLFNEGAGKKIFDNVKNNNATLINNPTWVWDQEVSGLKFIAGSNQYVTIPKKIDTAGAITFAFGNYVSTAAANYPVAFGGYGTSNTADRCLCHAPSTDNTLYWDYGDSAGTGRVSTDYALYLNKLVNVALVSEGIGGAFKGIYLDGILANSVASSDGPSGDVTIELGRFNGSNYDTGILTYFYIYNRILSASEIAWLDADPTGMFIPDFTPSKIQVTSSAGAINSIITDGYGSFSNVNLVITDGYTSAVVSTGKATIFGMDNGENTFIFGGQVIR